MVRLLALVSLVVVAGISSASAAEDPAPARPAPFRIEVVDEETGRGVPLVELRTVNQIRYFTDSNGVAAFDEPALLGRKVFFSVSSHGYEYAKDGLGYRGKALDTVAGGSAKLVIRRINLARRLYRVTGAGIYRDSLITGGKAPIREPLLDGLVLGQDSVLTAVYGGKIHWFWGDTNRPDYPLGNFHVPGATSELPAHGGLDPEVGVDLKYYLDERGFARPTAAMPGEGPTWLSALVVLKDQSQHERMFAAYAKVRKMLEIYERGLVEWNPKLERFEKLFKFPDASRYSGELPDGHPFLVEEGGVSYVYFANPYPFTRVRAEPDQYLRLENYEAFTCLLPGVKPTDPPKLDRDRQGRLRYMWRKGARVLREDEQRKLLGAVRMGLEESLINLRDLDTGKPVRVHGSTVSWNDWAKRFMMIAVESGGSSSYLGEVWFSLADSPIGPWRHARKIVTHDHYSFYNPRHHPMLDKDGGRLVFFEGTYTATFSGNPDPTPRYDYNQVMYSLDVSSRALALPVAIRDLRARPADPQRLSARPWAGGEDSGREGSGGEGSGGEARRPPILFYAPERPGIATVPVFLGEPALPDRAPAFYVLSIDSEYVPDTTPLYETVDDQGARLLTVEPPRPGARGRVLGVVWRVGLNDFEF